MISSGTDALEFARRGAKTFLGAAICLSALTALAVQIEDPIAAPAGSTTRQPAELYDNHCGACHGPGPGFGGGVGPNIGPPLSGSAFNAKWSAASSAAFSDYVRTTMPPATPNSLDSATYAAINGYIRSVNNLTDEPNVATAAAAQRAAGDTVASWNKANHDAEYRTARQRLEALANRMTPVTDALLGEGNPQDWLAWRRSQSARGYSPLRQINRSNVGRLALAWSLSLGTGTNAIVPLVHDGVMFVNSNGTIRALDAGNGDAIWEYARSATTTRVPLSQPRGMALYGNAVYAPTIDNHVLALDARTGKLLWDQELAKPASRLQTTSAPLAVRGKIIQGVAGCQGNEYPGGCFVVALDAASGKEVWRFHTIARPGQPGGDSWNGAPVDQRFGASVWMTPSYDPDLNLVYVGTGQTYIISTLLNPNPRPGESKDALYTDTTLALNPDTGELVWHYQHMPGDVWDLDWAFERVLVTLSTPNGPQKAVVTAGKLGIIDAVDAKTGRYLWSRDLGLQNLITAIDPKTGRKTYDPRLTPEAGTPKLVCPGPLGGPNWNATAYDPQNGILYLPMAEACMDISFKKTNFGEILLMPRVPPGSDGKFGRVVAVDLNTQQIVWTNRRRAVQASAMLATAGGLVFEGARDRWFRALDNATGKTLWQARLDETPNSFPITFMVGNTQYVAVVTGGGTPVDLSYRSFTPEIRSSTGNKTLMVFALPAKPGKSPK